MQIDHLTRPSAPSMDFYSWHLCCVGLLLMGCHTFCVEWESVRVLWVAHWFYKSFPKGRFCKLCLMSAWWREFVLNVASSWIASICMPINLLWATARFCVRMLNKILVLQLKSKMCRCVRWTGSTQIMSGGKGTLFVVVLLSSSS